jgi:hypothetical protein
LRSLSRSLLQLKDTAAANLFFEQALFCLQQVENEDLKVNLYRARLLECMIACLNNSALCCLTLREWQKAADGSRQAMMLVDALDRKRGGEIVKVMGEKLGVDEGRLFVDWRCKVSEAPASGASAEGGGRCRCSSAAEAGKREGCRGETPRTPPAAGDAERVADARERRRRAAPLYPPSRPPAAN